MQKASDGGCGCGELGVADQQQPQQGGSPGDKNPSPAMSPIGATQTYTRWPMREQTVSTHQPDEPGAGGRGKRSMSRAIPVPSAKSCPTLCNPMGRSSLGSSVHGILQARILKWFAISHSGESSQPRDGTTPPVSPALASRFFTTRDTWEDIPAPGVIQMTPPTEDMRMRRVNTYKLLEHSNCSVGVNNHEYWVSKPNEDISQYLIVFHNS